MDDNQLTFNIAFSVLFFVMGLPAICGTAIVIASILKDDNSDLDEEENDDD